MKLKLTQLNCKYGAPMGRRNIVPDWAGNPGAQPLKLHLQRMRMVDGDYDTGGAYWGGPCAHGCMWCAFSGSETATTQLFVRAKTRADAIAQVEALKLNITFFRR